MERVGVWGWDGVLRCVSWRWVETPNSVGAAGRCVADPATTGSETFLITPPTADQETTWSTFRKVRLSGRTFCVLRAGAATPFGEGRLRRSQSMTLCI